MESFALRSPSTLTPALPSSSSSRRIAIEKSSFLSGQAISFPRSSKSTWLDSRKPRAPAIGTTSQDTAGTVRKKTVVIKQEMGSKDVDLAFVAGATGRVGSRTVRELLKLGFRVRAGVRSAQRAESLVQSVRQMKLKEITGSSGVEPAERLELVECDLENQREIKPAIGDASIVICCIGASEKEVFDVTGPYRIDYKATKNLIDAATLAKVDHFILVTSLGTNKIGFPAAILNLFWGVLIWKRKAEETLIASGLPYTIVRPGGMERPTDAFKETHNLVLATEDTLFGGLVSNLQIAELMACMAKNRRLSYCKVVEVIAETTAPLTPMEELLAKIPSQRKVPAELEPESVPPSIDSKPTASVVAEESNKKGVLKTRPLSPYTMYEDLKPPTSPIPTPSTSKEKILDGAPPLKSNSGNGAAGTSTTVVNEDENEQHLKQHRPQPLSPFTMYEDLKPPSSPMPSVPK